MITRSLFASLGAAALLASPMIASAATTTTKNTTTTMAPAKMATPAACKGMTGKKMSDCTAKYQVKTTSTSTTTKH